jgi:bifunctional non-homologous end joining protein LigD
MSLVEYRRKRHFGKTREPEPGTAVEARRAIFVVQLHHASRRHYDFRLQVGDTLKSWAVPKGPSYDPAVKRMAVEVEDHPLDYASFEGEIPKGEYGGGHVAQFDHGVWSSPYDVEAQLAKGHLQFELFGEKLKGGWHLVRSHAPAKQPQWLLIKQKDEYAGPLEADDLLADVAAPPAADAKRAGSGKAAKKKLAAVPVKPASRRRVDWAKRALALPGARKATLKDAAFAPQLAKLVDAPPAGADWLHEVKWDGYRLVATITRGAVRIWSRNAIEWTDKVPEIRDALAALGLDSAALDGELIAGAGTQADFGLLQATLSGERQGALSYVLFDLLHLQGIALDAVPLVARKALLQDLLAPPPRHLAFSSHIPGDGDAAFALASAQAFEGIVSKRADGRYHAGRADDWKKTKRLESEEFAVVGVTPGKGARSGFGSLLLARPDATHGWVYVGRVGSGFTDRMLTDLGKRIGKAGAATPTVHVPEGVDADLRQARWFAPMFVVEVIVRGRGNSGVLRQPSLKGLRPDKDVADLVGDDAAPAKPARKAATKAAKTAAAKAATKAATKTATKNATKNATKSATKAVATSSARAETTQPPRAPLPPTRAARLSSPTKVVFPDVGITKQEVADYYAAVMPHLLPGIAGRPLSVIRCPDGAGKPCFFQKHHTPGLAEVDLVRLKEEGGNNANYLVARTAEGVMELVQFNGLEFHPWGAHAETPDRADRIVFDLDPGPGVPFASVKSAAVQVRDLLAELELQSFLRTTGGKGLHVVVPLNPGCDWDIVKRFARGFAEAMAQSEPKRYVAVSTLKARPGKIYVDYLRNGRGATAVASYSLRARDRAPVAMPLAWKELATLERGDAFTLRDVPARLKKRRKDPWASIDAVKQDLARWSR